MLTGTTKAESHAHAQGHTPDGSDAELSRLPLKDSDSHERL